MLLLSVANCVARARDDIRRCDTARAIRPQVPRPQADTILRFYSNPHSVPPHTPTPTHTPTRRQEISDKRAREKSFQSKDVSTATLTAIDKRVRGFVPGHALGLVQFSSVFSFKVQLWIMACHGEFAGMSLLTLCCCLDMS